MSFLGIKSKLLFLGGEAASEGDSHPPWLLSLWKKIKHKTFDRGEVDEGKHICGATILLREWKHGLLNTDFTSKMRPIFISTVVRLLFLRLYLKHAELWIFYAWADHFATNFIN